METNQHTERLIEALIEARAPQEMIERTRAGRYDRARTPIEQLPMKTLVDDATKYKLTGIGLRAMDGEFDAPRQDCREEL
jgi:hypothetical protein